MTYTIARTRLIVCTCPGTREFLGYFHISTSVRVPCTRELKDAFVNLYASRTAYVAYERRWWKDVNDRRTATTPTTTTRNGHHDSSLQVYTSGGTFLSFCTCKSSSRDTMGLLRTSEQTNLRFSIKSPTSCHFFSLLLNVRGIICYGWKTKKRAPKYISMTISPVDIIASLSYEFIVRKCEFSNQLFSHW